MCIFSVAFSDHFFYVAFSLLLLLRDYSTCGSNWVRLKFAFIFLCIELIDSYSAWCQWPSFAIWPLKLIELMISFLFVSDFFLIRRTITTSVYTVNVKQFSKIKSQPCVWVLKCGQIKLISLFVLLCMRYALKHLMFECSIHCQCHPIEFTFLQTFDWVNECVRFCVHISSL